MRFYEVNVPAASMSSCLGSWCRVMGWYPDFTLLKHLHNFDTCLVTLASHKTLLSEPAWAFRSQAVYVFMTLDRMSLCWARLDSMEVQLGITTCDEPQVILTPNTSQEKMSKTNIETSTETAKCRIKCKRILCQSHI